MDKKALKLINKFKPDFIFVAFGAPKQEKWVYRNLRELHSELVMVVGSSFDYIAGTRKHVPHVFDRLGIYYGDLTGSQNLKRIAMLSLNFHCLY
jgi:N-acetylglucosaminyldiphosphoundecaprenol N-acetyl-beta-D-mannosaminyltransferase